MLKPSDPYLRVKRFVLRGSLKASFGCNGFGDWWFRFTTPAEPKPGEQRIKVKGRGHSLDSAIADAAIKLEDKANA